MSFTTKRVRPIGPGPPGGPRPVRLPAVRAMVAGAAAFVTGLVAAGVVVPAGLAMLRAGQNPIQPLTPATELRVIVGYAALAAAATLLALGLAALVKRGIVAVGLVVVPYVSATALAADGHPCRRVRDHAERAHVRARGRRPVAARRHFPLPPWAGMAVTCGYAVFAVAVAMALSGPGRWPCLGRSR